MFKDILSLILVLAAIVLVLYLSYVFSRFISRKSAGVHVAQYVRVVDRLPVGQDRSMLIVEIQGRYFLISVTAQAVQIMKELDDFAEDAAPEGAGNPTFGESFKAVFQNMTKKK